MVADSRARGLADPRTSGYEPFLRFTLYVLRFLPPPGAKRIAHFSITTPTDVTHIINVTCPDVSDKQTVGAPVDAAAARYTRLKTVDFSSD